MIHKTCPVWSCILVALTLFAMTGCGGGGGGHDAPTYTVLFSFTSDTGQINSLPSGTDHVKVILDGRESTVVVGPSASPMSFQATLGSHTYSAQALSGTTVLAGINSITFTVVSEYPLTIPLAFGYPTFDTNPPPNTIGDTALTLIYFGTTGRDRVVQYGGSLNDLLSVDCNAGNDWIEQYGGGGDDTLIANGGTGDDYIYQEGGARADNLTAIGGIGNDWIIQKGGSGDDLMNTIAGDANDYIYQEGGDGNDTIMASGGSGDDTIIIDAGPGDDTIWYFVEYGVDTGLIDGGTGIDTLIVPHWGMVGPTQNYQIVNGSGGTIVDGGAGGAVTTISNIEFLIDYGDNSTHTGDNVTFTLTFASGSLNSVPSGADRVIFSVDGAPVSTAYKLTSETGSAGNPLRASFFVTAGTHTYAIQALNGSTMVASIGPIDFTFVDGFPLTIPAAFGYSTFDNYESINPYLGTPNRDRIVQYGGAANDTLSVSCGAGDDWSEQYGGGGDDSITAVAGTGNDYVLQSGGDGNDVMYVAGADGNDWIFQYGDAGDDDISVQGGGGDDVIVQEGGEGADTMAANGGSGNDSITIRGGAGNDNITYDVSDGTDVVVVDGGTGTDTLTVNTNGLPVLIQNTSLQPIYQTGTGGTTITVENVEHITVYAADGTTVLFQN